MSDITAQAFRDAAATYHLLYDTEPLRRLLLAAAEQREQLDRYKQLALKQDQALGTLPEENARLLEQIATLTAELIDARHRIMELEMPPTDYTLLPLLGKKPNE